MNRRKHRSEDEVSLNYAAMLDMAFQLLAFFILTFRPAPIESQIALRMPPPVSLAGGRVDPGKDPSSIDPLSDLKRLVISVTSTKQGEIDRITFGESERTSRGVGGEQIEAFRRTLARCFAGATLEQVVLQCGSGLRYERVMQLVDICADQQMADGKRLTQLTFTEFADGSLPPEPEAKPPK